MRCGGASLEGLPILGIAQKWPFRRTATFLYARIVQEASNFLLLAFMALGTDIAFEAASVEQTPCTRLTKERLVKVSKPQRTGPKQEKEPSSSGDPSLKAPAALEP